MQHRAEINYKPVPFFILHSIQFALVSRFEVQGATAIPSEDSRKQSHNSLIWNDDKKIMANKNNYEGGWAEVISSPLRFISEYLYTFAKRI